MLLARPVPLALFLLAAVPAAATAASLQSIGRLAGHDGSEAVGVSDDGQVVAGNSFDGDLPDAVRWTAGGLAALPTEEGATAFAESVSADGTAIVGQLVSPAGIEAFRWRQGTGTVGLGDAPGGAPYSVAFACSASGDLAVGVIDEDDGGFAARWDGLLLSRVGPGDLPTGTGDAIAFAVSHDGAVIAGDADTSAGYSGFRWTAGAGMVPLADLAGGTSRASCTGSPRTARRSSG